MVDCAIQVFYTYWFLWLVLSITEKGVWKSPNVIVDLFTSFSSISLCFMYLKALLLTTYIDIYNCYILIYFIIMKCQWPLLILVLSPCLKVYFIRCWYSHSFHNISVLYILFTFFSGCPRICDILQLTQVHFGCLRKFSFHLHFWRIIL